MEAVLQLKSKLIISSKLSKLHKKTLCQHSFESAHKKGSGSTKNGRDSVSKRRGVKLFHGQIATCGSIIVRQVGNKFHAGKNVGCGKDFTLFSLIEGNVKFEKIGGRKSVSVYPSQKARDNNVLSSRREYRDIQYKSRKAS